MILKLLMNGQKKEVELEQPVSSLPKLKEQIGKAVGADFELVQMSFIDIDDEVVELKDDYDFEYMLEQNQGQAVVCVDLPTVQALPEPKSKEPEAGRDEPTHEPAIVPDDFCQQILTPQFMDSLNDEKAEQVQTPAKGLEQAVQTMGDDLLSQKHEDPNSLANTDNTLDLSMIPMADAPKFEPVDTKYDFTKHKAAEKAQAYIEEGVACPQKEVAANVNIEPHIEEAIGNSNTLKELKSRLDLLTDIVQQGFTNIKADMDNLSRIESLESSKIIQKQAVNTTHLCVTCDGCREAPVKGKRFKCLVCPNFDLCEACEEKGEHKHPMMVFYSVVNDPFAEQMTTLFRLKSNLAALNDIEMKTRILKNIAGDKYPLDFYTQFVVKRKDKSLADFIEEVQRIFA